MVYITMVYSSEIMIYVGLVKIMSII